MAKHTGSKLQIANNLESLLISEGYQSTGVEAGKHTTGFKFSGFSNNDNLEGEIRVYWPNVIQLIVETDTNHVRKMKFIFGSDADCFTFIQDAVNNSWFINRLDVPTIPSIYGSKAKSPAKAPQKAKAAPKTTKAVRKPRTPKVPLSAHIDPNVPITQIQGLDGQDDDTPVVVVDYVLRFGGVEYTLPPDIAEDIGQQLKDQGLQI